MLAIHWFLPTGGDSRDVVAAGPDDQRPPDHAYLTQVARAADRLGFDAALTPCGTACEDAWIATATLVPVTERLRFLVAFRPGLLSPTLAAQMASTYQRLSGGRVLLNIVIGAEDAESARFGPRIDKATRYARAAEFLEIVRGAWSGEPFTFTGEFYEVTDATTRGVPDPQPAIYFGGASPEAEEVAARWADVYLAWGEPPAMVGERVERMRARAAAHDRRLRYGIRFHVITRPTADEAWAAAGRLLAGISPEAIAAAQADFAATASEGQRRMAELHRGLDPSDVRGLEVHPNVWTGVGLVRGGAGTTLVGSHAEVADRIEEYAGVGFEEFILSGYPHLEEAYWCGEGLLPELRRRGLVPELPTAAEATFSTFR
ncbi:LLM class flavin-dependent oxidoreductase [Iamia sp. SCSIO 61187]|uniref:LLM class flavin-dependent oxidoreductase n=1 Tax=Iamia sp. SCSIO 61187 TaxID=2722752 RepID=UPI001C62A46F|nr:LLM class flavin-dependent oxidoreductase [Iamia sp. SCSIO 61187]QYG92320.1 LLM class flavin-dependent oxidoreductase [Iamia sp. SCSIO 61187]